MSKNRNLNKAKINKNDEFYTRMVDIENELQYYTHHFKDKIVYCNCDDPKHSKFWRYFYDNFHSLGLKHLTATYYQPRRQLWLKGDTYRFDYDGRNIEKKKIHFFGEFQSYDCIQAMKQSDIICTNPPFSQFAEFIKLLTDENKDFLVIGNMNSVGLKDIFELYNQKRFWFGVNHRMIFTIPDGSEIDMGLSCWYTNLHHNIMKPFMHLTRKYNENDYPMYDNYNAIEVSKVDDIPMDYPGEMGVPVTFFIKYNPNQFEIVNLDRLLDKTTIINDRFFVDGEEKYARLIIRRII